MALAALCICVLAAGPGTAHDGHGPEQIAILPGPVARVAAAGETAEVAITLRNEGDARVVLMDIYLPGGSVAGARLPFALAPRSTRRLGLRLHPGNAAGPLRLIFDFGADGAAHLTLERP